MTTTQSRLIVPRVEMSRYHQGRKRDRNPSPPSFSQRQVVEESKPRKVRQVTSAADHAELEKHYSFLPSNNSTTETYQDRMVKHYHSHLYKEYVLADLTTRPGQVGLRWRTAEEVKRGKGNATCGNKHCPSYASPSQIQNTDSLREYYTQQSETNEEEELLLLAKVSHGLGLHDYEVPFTYQEHGDSKTELVKLRLCLRCAPLLFQKKDSSVDSSLEARRARDSFDRGGEDRKREYSSDASLSSTASQEKRQHRRKKKKKRRSKR